jgi:hypothetical protein
MRSYPYLTRDEDSPPEIGPHEVVIQQRQRAITYHVFSSVEELYTWYMRLHPLKRNCHEVIWGHRDQKFRMDIDGPMTPQETQALLGVLHSLFRDLGVGDITPILYDIQTSHHVVIPQVAFEGSGVCHMIATLITDHLRRTHPRLASLIDLGVYKKLQMFRLEGSTKYLQSRWKVHPQTDRVVDYALSLHLISPWLGEEGKEGEEEGPSPETPVPFSQGQVLDKRYLQDGTFTIRERKGELILLRRHRPSLCEVCSRVHHHENPYLFRGRLYCRRATPQRVVEGKRGRVLLPSSFLPRVWNPTLYPSS